MTITLVLWHVLALISLSLIIAPFIYSSFMPTGSSWWFSDNDIKFLLCLFVCWGAGAVFGIWAIVEFFRS